MDDFGNDIDLKEDGLDDEAVGDPLFVVADTKRKSPCSGSTGGCCRGAEAVEDVAKRLLLAAAARAKGETMPDCE